MTAKSEREREFFLFIFKLKLLGLVSIEIFTSNLGNLCFFLFFILTAEILFTKQVFFSCLQKILLVLAVVNVIKMG